jgi:NADPH2:quinone reductase
MTQFSSRAIQITQHGGPEQMAVVTVTVGDPGPGEIRIRHKAVGLNFIDVYQRSGLYPMNHADATGHGGCGCGRGGGRRGDPFAGGRPGSLRQPAARQLLRTAGHARQVCVQVARRIDFDTGAAMMLKGLTAQYLLRHTLPQGGTAAPVTLCCSMPQPVVWA